MLYDKRWDRTEAKPDVLSLESLIAWLEKWPAEKEYCFADYSGCLLGQWLKGMDPRSTNEDDGCNGYIYAVHGQYVDLRPGFKDIVADAPHTFGAALKRARAALAHK